MTKAQLIEKMTQRSGMSQKYATDAVDCFLAVITDALKKGETVNLPGFGTFMVREKATRQVRSLRTREMITVPARRIAAFRAGIRLKDAISGRSVQKGNKSHEQVKA